MERDHLQYTVFFFKRKGNNKQQFLVFMVVLCELTTLNINNISPNYKMSFRYSPTILSIIVDFLLLKSSHCHQGVWLILCFFVCSDDCWLWLALSASSSTSSCYDPHSFVREKAWGGAHIALYYCFAPAACLLSVSQSVKVLAKLPRRKLWITPTLPAALVEGGVCVSIGQLWIDSARYSVRYTDLTSLCFYGTTIRSALSLPDNIIL